MTIVQDMTKEHIIQQYSLQPHPEGGWYAEVYRANEKVSRDPDRALPHRRSAATMIYYLLDADTNAAWHKLSCDEVWIHLEGDPVHLHSIRHDKIVVQNVGRQGSSTALCVIPGDTWFRAECKTRAGWGLCVCVVAPGFEFADFEMQTSSELSKSYPFLLAHESIMNEKTRSGIRE